MNIDDSYTWVNDYPVPEAINRVLLLIEHHKPFINHMQFNTQHKDRALAEIITLLSQAEEAADHLYVAGCLPSQDNLLEIDEESKEHSHQYIDIISNHKHKNMLKSTKNKVEAVIELIIDYKTQLFQKIASWSSPQSYPHIPTHLSPETILQTDTKLLLSGLTFIKEEIKKNESSTNVPQRPDTTIGPVRDIDAYQNQPWRENIFEIIENNVNGSPSYISRMRDGIATVATVKLMQEYEKNLYEDTLNRSESIIGFNYVIGYGERTLVADTMEQIEMNLPRCLNSLSESENDNKKKQNEMLWENMIRCLAIGYKQEPLMVHKQTIPTNSIANINDVKSLLPEDGDSLNESRSSVYSDYLTESCDSLNRSSGSLGNLSYSSDINDNSSKENSQFYIKNSTAIVDLPDSQDFINISVIIKSKLYLLVSKS